MISLFKNTTNLGLLLFDLFVPNFKMIHEINKIIYFLLNNLK